MSDLFLTREEVVQLTGLQHKQKQIVQLRKMGILFWINAQDVPVVPRSAIDGRTSAPSPERRVKVVPLAFRSNLLPADVAEIAHDYPATRKK